MHAQAIAVSGWKLAATVIGGVGSGFLLSSVKPPIMQDDSPSHRAVALHCINRLPRRPAGGESPQLECVVHPTGVWTEAFLGKELRNRKAVHAFEGKKGDGLLDVWFQCLIGSC